MKKNLAIIAITSMLLVGVFAQSHVASALDTTATAVQPPSSSLPAGTGITLQAQVIDRTTSTNIPTGTVKWDDGNAGGIFSGGPQCILDSTGMCKISYVASPQVPPGGSVTITATYIGDSNHAGSSGTSTLTVTTPPPPPGNTATGTVTILGFCGIVVSPGTINFGSLAPGGPSSLATNNPIGVTNNGNTQASPVSVSGTNWLAGSTVGIVAQNTAFSTNTAAGPFMPLPPVSPPGGPQSTVVLTQSLNPGTTLNTYWQLTPITTSSQIIGQLTQTVTFSGGC